MANFKQVIKQLLSNLISIDNLINLINVTLVTIVVQRLLIYPLNGLTINQATVVFLQGRVKVIFILFTALALLTLWLSNLLLKFILWIIIKLYLKRSQQRQIILKIELLPLSHKLKLYFKDKIYHNKIDYNLKQHVIALIVALWLSDILLFLSNQLNFANTQVVALNQFTLSFLFLGPIGWSKPLSNQIVHTLQTGSLGFGNALLSYSLFVSVSYQFTSALLPLLKELMLNYTTKRVK
jgi:hypothetical protein